jgi:hypothetical protein
VASSAGGREIFFKDGNCYLEGRNGETDGCFLRQIMTRDFNDSHRQEPSRNSWVFGSISPCTIIDAMENINVSSCFHV